MSNPIKTDAPGSAPLSRRQVIGGITGAAGAGIAAGLGWPVAAAAQGAVTDFRIRTITAGISLGSAADFHAVDGALDFLAQARRAFTDTGYTVQTVRIATQPVGEYLPAWDSAAGIAALRQLDRHLEPHGLPVSIGQILRGPDAHPGFADWMAELVTETRQLNGTAVVGSIEHGVHTGACDSAARAIHALAQTGTGGEDNFRFAATAFCPPGTPFFPAAWHQGQPAFALGLESPPLLTAAFTGAASISEGAARLRERLETQLAPVEAQARELSQATGWRYLGIDASPAPGIDASIGQAIETLTGAPFGSASTLAACAAITGVLQSLSIETCGYSGLMLPVLEDPVLAARATEGRYGIQELLLYSSVCGTGLDVVPLPGDTPPEKLAAAITDVAALAARYRKALSARLFPVPGRQAGEIVTFDNPYLTDATVLPLG
ncbi:DUF711 family protein [Elongatibacter sediminis]|uniref:DUF711 family protein n=1 Tax=Elongatibacter sediminis TaxID=3119006 RepID=A0AAW9RPA1_9GAMM